MTKYTPKLSRREFVTMTEWVAKRWMDSPWTAEETVVIYEEVQSLPAAACWRALRLWFDDGNDFPPRASRFARLAKESTAYHQLQRPALPVAAEPDALERFAESHNGMSPHEWFLHQTKQTTS